MSATQTEIMSKPELFVELDPELPLALLDQKEVFFINNLILINILPFNILESSQQLIYNCIIYFMLGWEETLAHYQFRLSLYKQNDATFL